MHTFLHELLESNAKLLLEFVVSLSSVPRTLLSVLIYDWLTCELLIIWLSARAMCSTMVQN